MAEQFKALTFTTEVRSLNPLLTSHTGVNSLLGFLIFMIYCV